MTRPRLHDDGGGSPPSRRVDPEMVTAQALRVIAALDRGQETRPRDFVEDCIVAVRYLQQRNLSQARVIEGLKSALREANSSKRLR